MAEIKITDLAKTLRSDVDTLIARLATAGIEKDIDSIITDEEKKTVIQALRAQSTKKTTTVLQTAQTTTPATKRPLKRQKTPQTNSSTDFRSRLKQERLERELASKRAQLAQKQAERAANPKTTQKTTDTEETTDSTNNTPHTTKAQPRRSTTLQRQTKKSVPTQTSNLKKHGNAPAPEERLAAEMRAKREQEEKERARARERLHLAVDRMHKRRRREAVEIENKHGFAKPASPVIREVEITATTAIADLAHSMAVKTADIIKVLFEVGITVTPNQAIDQDTATFVVEEMGHTPIFREKTADEIALQADIDTTEQAPRPPIVTVMGHVDHGKTTLLDHIRNASVAEGEAGGITQHIGAYQVTVPKRGIITFIDTPGHAAFSAMRARGAHVTDIVVLVVSADDGVMPQTVEAIAHAKAAEVPIIVAMNKIDKEGADPERIKQELAKHEVVCEDWGGEHLLFPVSALRGTGVDALLEGICLQAELLELTAPVTGAGYGVVIESCMEKGRGAVATVLLQRGVLQQGDVILCGTQYGRVRQMYDDNGTPIKQGTIAQPVQISGLSGVPNTGDECFVVENERQARDMANKQREKLQNRLLKEQQAQQIDSLFDAVSEQGKIESVTVLIKADTHGSSEAIRDALTGLSHDKVAVKVVATGVGGINESDVQLASSANAAMIGFNVRADANARKLIAQRGLTLTYYSIIYELIDDIKAAMDGLVKDEYRDHIIGVAEVRDVFRAKKIGAVAGCLVTEGIVKRSNPIRVLRENIVIFEGALESLKRFQDDVNEVRSGTECGIGVKDYDDVKTGDHIEVYERRKVARTATQ